MKKIIFILLLIGIYNILSNMVFMDPSDMVAKSIVLADTIEEATDIYNTGLSTLTKSQFDIIIDFKVVNNNTHLEEIYNFLTTSKFDLWIGRPVVDFILSIWDT